MKVVIAGATGALGRPLVRQLVEAGHDVVGITRTEAGASALRSAGAQAVIADVMQADALLAAFEGQKADAVVHELTALSKVPTRYSDMERTNALRTEGSANLIALRYGLRYGLLYGGDLATFERMLRKHSLPVPDGRQGTLALVHHSDAAAATVAALERGQAGAYNIVDDRPTTWNELIEGIAESRHAPKPMILPGWLLRLVAPYAGVMMTRVNQKVPNDKAKRELGWVLKYPTIREGLGLTGRA